MTKCSPTSVNTPLPILSTGEAALPSQGKPSASTLTFNQALAEGHACEQSARRNAMDVSNSRLLSYSELQPSNIHISQNASKNAGDMINKFQILYNRTRQAVITGELVEIITGASASEG